MKFVPVRVCVIEVLCFISSFNFANLCAYRNYMAGDTRVVEKKNSVDEISASYREIMETTFWKSGKCNFVVQI